MPFEAARGETGELPIDEAPRFKPITPIVDARGKLPTILDGAEGAGSGYDDVANNIYGHRLVDGLVGITLHYTAGPTVMSPRAVALIQLERDAAPGTKFPGLAYTYIVDGDGTPYLAWDLDVKVWHSAAPGYNAGRVGICYTGDYAPTEAQIIGIRSCIADVYRQLRRVLPVDGHKDKYATECPGSAWPTWKDQVMP